jgi:spore maturation protein CgeB
VTERQLLHLVRHGVPLKVYGGGWDDAAAASELSEAVQHRFVMGDEYARAIVSFDVNLGIVSKWNRNHTASRTFQIPALGAFLLHERNELVTRYFKEGEEAEFFGSDDELLEKCRHYLAHPEERRRIAAAGRQRCIESGYFEPDRVREILPALEDALRAHRAGS